MADLKLLTPSSLKTTPSYLDIFKLAFGPFTAIKLEKVFSEYESSKNAQIYGLFVLDEIAGIIGYKKQGAQLIINQIAIAKNKQGNGYGKELINHIIKLEAPTEVHAETDDDAVGFYGSLGFVCSSFESVYGNKRYRCVLEKKGYEFSKKLNI